MSRARRLQPLMCLLAILCCGVLLSCSGDEDGDESTAVPPPPTSVPAPGSTTPNLTGRYRGTAVSTVAVGTSTLVIEFFQAAGNPTVTGTITFTGSPCFRGGTIVGTLSGLAFDGLVQFGGGIQITILGTFAVDAAAASGGYAVNMNNTACSRDQGQFTIVRQP